MMAHSFRPLLAWHAPLKEQQVTGMQQYCIPGWSTTVCPEERMWLCPGDAPAGPPSLTLADVDYCVMHSPFVKMVRKGFARIFYQDHLRADIRRTARQVMPGQASTTVSCCNNWGTLCNDNGTCVGLWELLRECCCTVSHPDAGTPAAHGSLLTAMLQIWLLASSPPWSVGCECMCLGNTLRQTGQFGAADLQHARLEAVGYVSATLAKFFVTCGNCEHPLLPQIAVSCRHTAGKC